MLKKKFIKKVAGYTFFVNFNTSTTKLIPMKPITRIEEFIELTGTNATAFEKKINVSTGTISKAIKKQSSLRDDTWAKIFDAYPELNPMYVLFGKGELYQKATPGDVIQRYIDKQLKDIGAAYENRIDTLETKIVDLINASESAKMVSQIDEKLLKEILTFIAEKVKSDKG